MRKIMKTEGAVRRMGYGSCLLLLLVLFSCTSIDETLAGMPAVCPFPV